MSPKRFKPPVIGGGDGGVWEQFELYSLLDQSIPALFHSNHAPDEDLQPIAWENQWNPDDPRNANRDPNGYRGVVLNLWFRIRKHEAWARNPHVVRSYVDLAFRRALEQRRLLGYYPADSNDMLPTWFIFNTGIVYGRGDRLCALFFRRPIANGGSDGTGDADGDGGIDGDSLYDEHGDPVYVLHDFLMSRQLLEEVGELGKEFGLPSVPHDTLPQAPDFWEFSRAFSYDPKLPFVIPEHQQIFKRSDRMGVPATAVPPINDHAWVGFLLSLLATADVHVEAGDLSPSPYYHRPNCWTTKPSLLFPAVIANYQLPFSFVVSPCYDPSTKETFYYVSAVLSRSQSAINSRLFGRRNFRNLDAQFEELSHGELDFPVHPFSATEWHYYEP